MQHQWSAHVCPYPIYHVNISRILLIETEISHQDVGAQNYKRTCIAALKVLSHNAIKIFVSQTL